MQGCTFLRKRRFLTSWRRRRVCDRSPSFVIQFKRQTKIQLLGDRGSNEENSISSISFISTSDSSLARALRDDHRIVIMTREIKSFTVVLEALISALPILQCLLHLFQLLSSKDGPGNRQMIQRQKYRENY